MVGLGPHAPLCSRSFYSEDTALGGGRRTCGVRPPPEDLATSAASGTLELLGARGVREFDLGGGDLPEIILLRIPVQHPDACS